MAVTRLEKLIEVKMALNELYASRIRYAHEETKKVLLANNEKYIELDLELLATVIKEIEIEKERCIGSEV